MTREEILALPAGRHLDALVAENVMGIPALSQREWQGQLLWIGGGDNDRTYTIAIPNYSESIAAAWLVVEHLKAQTSIIGMEYLPRRIEGAVWRFHFDASYGYAPTVPLAICRAALLAVMQPRGGSQTSPPAASARRGGQ